MAGKVAKELARRTGETAEIQAILIADIIRQVTSDSNWDGFLTNLRLENSSWKKLEGKVQREELIPEDNRNRSEWIDEHARLMLKHRVDIEKEYLTKYVRCRVENAFGPDVGDPKRIKELREHAEGYWEWVRTDIKRRIRPDNIGANGQAIDQAVDAYLWNVNTQINNALTEFAKSKEATPATGAAR